ncbi:hypothetical protein BDW68DRAFT_191649 [Aspergillus falconensis]
MTAGEGSANAAAYELLTGSEKDSEQFPDSAPFEYKCHALYSPNEWLFEGMSSLLALGIVIAIACIFSYMDKPLKDWKSPVSLTTSISILTTAYTPTSMHSVSSFIGQLKWLYFKDEPRQLSHLETFDDASRGVLGSLQLLTNVKWNLATMGAVITILRLIFSPFAQQVIFVYDGLNITRSDNVTFGYAHNYTRNILGDLANPGVSGIPQDPGVQSAILQGLYDITTPATFSCSGACDWHGTWVSLGFKNACQNVTEDTLRTRTCAEHGGDTDGQCNMTAPNGVRLSYRYYSSEKATSYYMSATALLGKPGSTMISSAYEYTDAYANGSEFTIVHTREVDFDLDGRNPWGYIPTDWGRMFARLRTNETTTEDNVTIPALEIREYDLLAMGNFFQSPTVNLGLAAALQGDVDIPARFKHMPKAMTDYLHKGSKANGPRVRIGQSGICVKTFFVIPLVAEALALLFAVLTVLRNRRSRKVLL